MSSAALNRGDADLSALINAYIDAALQSPHSTTSPSSPTDDILTSIGPNTDLNLFAILAQIAHFPDLPGKWTRVMCHAYNDVYSSVGTNLPRVPLQGLVPRAFREAKARCIASNPEWAPDEHELIDIDGVPTHTRWSSLEFRAKLKSTVARAIVSFHDHTFHCTLYLLTTQPERNALMPFLPIDGVMTFNDDQTRQVAWYSSWSDNFGHAVWHHVSDDDRLYFFANGYVRQFLHSALKDEGSPGFFGIQEPYRNNQGEWKWRPLTTAHGDKALVVLSYALGSYATSIYADFGMNRDWVKHKCCLARQAMVLESQKNIYEWLKNVTRLTVPGLTLPVRQCLRDALIVLLDELGFSL